MEDRKIIELFWDRNEDAIAQTDKVYGGKLLGLAERIVKCREDAEESVSDTYMKAWETIPPQRPCYLYAYLAKICRYYAFGKLDWKNAEKRRAEIVELTQEMELCIPDNSREKLAERKEIAASMNRFLEGLSVENRLIFMRRYWFCDSVAEIAQRYAISQGKVKTRLHRLRNQLHTHLQKEGIWV